LDRRWGGVLQVNQREQVLTAAFPTSRALKSFFWPLAYGRTYFAGINRVSWPSAANLRACAPHDKRGSIVLRQKWSRGQIETRLANLTPCLVGTEACVGGTRHCLRQVRLRAASRMRELIAETEGALSRAPKPS
jgi:hypothetical protein